MEGVDSLFHFPTITEDKNTELITNLGVKRAGQSISQQNYSRTLDVYLQNIFLPLLINVKLIHR